VAGRSVWYCIAVRDFTFLTGTSVMEMCVGTVTLLMCVGTVTHLMCAGTVTHRIVLAL